MRPTRTYNRAILGTVLRRFFIVLFLGAAILGAIRHTLAPGLYSSRGWVTTLLPQLAWGYVMFNRMPLDVSVVFYRKAGGVYAPAAELLPTASLGYSEARLALQRAMNPNLVNQWCHERPELRDYEFRIQNFRIGHGARLVSERHWRCGARGLESKP